MVDNVAVTPGAGASIATDDVAGVHYQIIKQAYGALDSATLVSTTNGLPVQGIGNFAVTGPLTDTQLRATAVPVSGTVTANLGTIAGVATETTLAALNTKVTAVNTGAVTISAALPAGANSIGRVEVDNEPSATARGRVTTFRTPGRAGTAGQKIFALHNATGSTKIVRINHIAVDLAVTVVKAITVLPPLIRVHRFTAVPTNGTALTKVSKDTALASNASITAWGDASADGTSSGTALTITIPAGNCLTQEFAPRFITAAGYEMFDRAELLVDQVIALRALEGIVVELAYTAAGQNPITDMWAVTCDWWEV